MPDLLATIAQGLINGQLAPFLGPETLSFDGPSPVPDASLVLAERLNAITTVPGRIRKNLWESAQWLESNKHRITLVRMMNEIFAPQPPPTRLHHWLASLDLPLIVDVWYDSLTADALTVAGKPFAQLQGIRRSGTSREEPWTKAYDASGAEITAEDAAKAPTLLYKPHGAVRPTSNYLISDSDYVEVLTEIDIQTPIPAPVIELRTKVGFVFLGCRFYDQMQRTFARQIIKRSAGPHYAVISGSLTKNEEKFLELEDIQPVKVELADAVSQLLGVSKAA